MRVLINTVFLASPRFGGSWTYTRNLLSSLEAYAGETEFIVLANARTAPLLRGLQMEVRVELAHPGLRALRVGWEELVLPRIARRYAPNVFHSTGNTLPPVRVCPAVVTLHDFQYHFYPGNFPALRRAYLRRAVPAALGRAKRVICISDFTRRHAAELYGADAGKLCVIHEAGLMPGELEGAAREETLRSRFRLERPFVLSAGSSLPHKNLRRLAEAFGLILHDVPHDLVIAGGDVPDPALREAVRRSGAEGRVRFTGFMDRPDLVGLYRSADLFVFPSLFEGFGIPALEAMECGCPVAASRAGSLPEVTGSAAEFFDPTDTRSMAETMRRICTDRSLREELKERGARRAAAFSWEKVGRETMQLYRSIRDN
ncbi:MAG: glycosyltransferase family 1 protein [Bacteroidota bacterium]